MSFLRIENQPLDWRKARRSIANGDCVELASANGQIVVRDSKDPSGSIIQYRADAWQSFLSKARRGEFDRLS